MADKLTVTVVTPLRKVSGGEVDMVILPAHQGEMGVLPGHDMYMALLGLGSLRLVTADKTQTLFVAGGYAEISDDHVTILAEVCERTDDIDLDRAAKAQKRAEERLHRAAGDDSIDINRAQAALMRAIYRQQLAKSGHIH